MLVQFDEVPVRAAPFVQPDVGAEDGPGTVVGLQEPNRDSTGVVDVGGALRDVARSRRQAGFRELEVLPVDAGMLRFYRLTP